MPAKSYPRRFTISTPDGAGAATKKDASAPWDVVLPRRFYQVHGLAQPAQAEILFLLREQYDRSEITFGKSEVVHD